MSEILDRLGIKIGKPLSRRQSRDIDRQEREWMREVMAYMKAKDCDFDTAFVECGGTIVPDAEPRR